MTDRTCMGCGLPEDRRLDAKGRPTVNLDPSTSLCVDCTIRESGKPKGFPELDAKDLPFDSAAARARNDD